MQIPLCTTAAMYLPHFMKLFWDSTRMNKWWCTGILLSFFHFGYNHCTAFKCSASLKVLWYASSSEAPYSFRTTKTFCWFFYIDFREVIFRAMTVNLYVLFVFTIGVHFLTEIVESLTGVIVEYHSFEVRIFCQHVKRLHYIFRVCTRWTCKKSCVF